MLTINNLNRILNKAVDIEWYIRGISLIDGYNSITKIMAEQIKNKNTDKNRIGMYYQTMYKKDFDAECSFNRIQYRVDSISKNTISK